MWGEWDEEARQDIPAPPSPRPSGCVLVPPHSRLSQSSGFSLPAGGNPNSALYGCSSVKLRILIKNYHNAFSLYCLVLLPALVSLLIWSRMIQKCFDHQPFSWDSSGRSHRMSPWTWAGAVEGISPVSPPQPRLLDPSPALCPAESKVRGRRCRAHALHISNHDMTSMKLRRTRIKRRKKAFQTLSSKCCSRLG